jgi:hypothetical protein
MKSGLQVSSKVEIAIYFVATSVVTLDLGGASTQVGFIFWSPSISNKLEDNNNHQLKNI